MRLATLTLLLTTFAVAVAKVFTVEVTSFIFNPSTITNAANGDIVQFVFSGTVGPHSVVQSSFDKPCQPITGGFNSGFVNPSSTGVSAPPYEEYNLTVTDAGTPIWFYCAQSQPKPHCLAGMFGSINSPTSGADTFPAYESAARNLKALPAQTPSSGPVGGVGASATAAPATGHNAAASTVAAPAIASLPSVDGTAGLPTTQQAWGTRSARALGLGGLVTAVVAVVAAVYVL